MYAKLFVSAAQVCDIQGAEETIVGNTMSSK
jgi:hypothetical protein